MHVSYPQITFSHEQIASQAHTNCLLANVNTILVPKHFVMHKKSKASIGTHAYTFTQLVLHAGLLGSDRSLNY